MPSWLGEASPLVSITNSVLFFGGHCLAVAGVIRFGWEPSWAAFALLAYCVQVFGITAGHHRYFSHRSFKTSRPGQFVLALMGAIAGQRGALWWAGHHRRHHARSDRAGDVHSPVEDGLYWAHVGWILSGVHARTPLPAVRDLARYPELVWLNRFHVLPPLLFPLLVAAVGGPGAAAWSLLSTIACYHVIFATNSVTHRWGARPFPTSDNSRNHPLIALLTFGEGWHNNHHHYPYSARVGFRWWQVDISFYVLVVLERLGLVWDLRRPPPALLLPPQEVPHVDRQRPGPDPAPSYR